MRATGTGPVWRHYCLIDTACGVNDLIHGWRTVGQAGRWVDGQMGEELGGWMAVTPCGGRPGFGEGQVGGRLGRRELISHRPASEV